VPGPNLYLIASSGLARSALEQYRMAAQKIADTLLESVIVAIVDTPGLAQVQTALGASGGKGYMLKPISTAPMGSAPFVYNDDGTPNWAAMWTTFCELALYGGPPHRSTDAALNSPGTFGCTNAEFNAIDEIKRGIAATTGLGAEAADPGWVAVTCRSRKMAAWLCATIILENVDARCDDVRLFLPAAHDFELHNQVKSVITVLAKANHYYQMHVEGTAVE
jgi:hypothetical protein